MERFLLIFILMLSFQTLTKADDISDFEIEGISIGDSLFDYYSKKELNNSIEIYKYKRNYSKELLHLIPLF